MPALRHVNASFTSLICALFQHIRRGASRAWPLTALHQTCPGLRQKFWLIVRFGTRAMWFLPLLFVCSCRFLLMLSVERLVSFAFESELCAVVLTNV
eukprot:scaffold63670_cov39-Tisochrysis_lutea.AAC.2